MFVEGYMDDTNPKKANRTIIAIPSIKPNSSLQMNNSLQGDSSQEQKDELQGIPNRKKHKPACMNDYELRNG